MASKLKKRRTKLKAYKSKVKKSPYYKKGKEGKAQKKIDKMARKRNVRKASGKGTKLLQKRINRRIRKQKKKK